MKRTLLPVIIAVLWLTVPSMHAQTTVTWSGGTGNWGTASNWTPNVVPNNSGLNTYNVQIDNGNAVASVVTVNVLNATVSNIALDMDDTLQLNTGSTLTVLGQLSGWFGGLPQAPMGNITTQIGSVLNANIGAAGGGPNITIGGTLNTSSISVGCCSTTLTLQPGSVLNNSGTVDVASGGGLLQLDGTFNNLAGATLGGGDLGFLHGSGTLNNWGTFTFGFGTPVLGAINNFASGVMNVEGITTGFLSNAGTINSFNGNQLFVSGPLDTLNTGTLSLTGAAGFGGLNLFGGGNYVQSAGTTILDGAAIDFNGGSAQFLGGQLLGCGTVNGNVLMSGTFIPGPCFSSFGTPVMVNGNYTQTAGGAYTANLGGLILGQDYNQVQIAGDAALNGILRLVVSGFTPTAGDAFVLMTYGSHSGTFSGISWSGLPAGLYFQVSYNANDVTATVRPVPEPASFLLFGSGILAAILRKRSRRIWE